MDACTKPYGASHKASRLSTSQPIGSRAATRWLGYQGNSGENSTQVDSSVECLKNITIEKISCKVNGKNETKE